MTVFELGEGYFSSAAACKERLRLLRGQLKRQGLSQSEAIMLRRRICILDAMERDCRATGRYLKRYYHD